VKSTNRASVLTNDASMHLRRKLRLAYVVTHPIQYQAPLLRRLALEPDIDLTVLFASDHSVRGYRDEGFGGARVKWDIPLLQGYRYEFLPTIRAATWTGFWAPINRGFYAAFRKGKYDVIWLHGYWSINSIFAMIAAKLLGIPLLLRAEGTLIDRRRSRLRLAIKRIFFSIACDFIDGVLPVGTRNRDYWLHYLGPQFPSFMTPYAVNNAYFEEMAARASHSREEFRQNLGLEKGRAIVLYASKLMERKRCVDLINAYLGIGTEAGGKRPYLLIVGDGPERARCEAMVREAGDSSTLFFGFQNQSQMAKFFDLCDVFVLPSVDEPFGLIVNEVMNAGRAIIVSDQVGCQPDLIEDGLTGKVFPAGDVLALRSAIESLLGDSTLRNVLGSRGLDRIKLWSFEDDIRGLREALHYVAGLPLCIETHDQVAAHVSA
jgi:glycosyltransferase involved in cell wall biosynthesis